jgi:hypothetical protein
MGRAALQRRGLDVQAVSAGGAARKDDKVPHLVPGATLADARLAVRHWAALVGKLWQERQEKSEATVIESQLVTSASRLFCAARRGPLLVSLHPGNRIAKAAI